MTPDESAPTKAGGPGPEHKGPMAMCPMAASCRRMAEGRFPRFLMPLPGLLFIAFGVLILLVPALLVWLIALACIGMGIMMLIFAGFMSRMGSQMRRMHP